MKTYFKPSVFLLSTIPFIIISYKIFLNKLGPEPIKEITHHTGEWTLLFLIFTLAMSPLKQITNMSIWISVRRMLGLFAFFYASLHMLTYVGLDYRFDNFPRDFIGKSMVFRSPAANSAQHVSGQRALSSVRGIRGGTYDETAIYRHARHSDAPALASYLANYLTII